MLPADAKNIQDNCTKCGMKDTDSTGLVLENHAAKKDSGRAIPCQKSESS